MLVGLVFLTYLAGTSSSPVAGRFGDRFGRRVVLLSGLLVTLAGALLTLTDVLAGVLIGLALFTVGFFAAHTSAVPAGLLRRQQRRGMDRRLRL